MTEETMQDVDHTNTDDPRNVFGEMFRRGPDTVADGGRETGAETQMRDVTHTTADETGAERVWSRGGEVEAQE